MLGPGALAGVPPPDDGHALPPAPRAPEIHFETRPGWGIELDARGGIGMLSDSEARGAFAFAGGFLRGHYSYFELGGFYDQADSSPSGGTFKHFGGFAGAWLPYHNWVDFDLALGLGSREYTDEDVRYGANGYSLGSAALTFMAGVSDRARSNDLGGRIGAQIVVTHDLTQRDKPWRLEGLNDVGEAVVSNGTTHIGGTSVALVVTLGLDYGATP